MFLCALFQGTFFYLGIYIDSRSLSQFVKSESKAKKFDRDSAQQGFNMI